MRKRKVRWKSLQVNLRQKIYARLKEELREAESEMEVSYCELEQGPLLWDDDEAERERLIEILMDSVKSTNKLMKEMIVRSNETKMSYVFESDDLFFITGFVVDDRQFFETILKFDEESLSNEEKSEVLQQNELIDELIDWGTQSIEDDLKMKAEKEMCKDISIRKDQICILVK